MTTHDIFWLKEWLAGGGANHTRTCGGMPDFSGLPSVLTRGACEGTPGLSGTPTTPGWGSAKAYLVHMVYLAHLSREA